jgi:hypothetical protein
MGGTAAEPTTGIVCCRARGGSDHAAYIDGACVLTDSDGDQIFSTFDTRDTDKSQPEMKCGTHIITGGTGKYKGITGSEPFACITMPALGGPGRVYCDGFANPAMSRGKTSRSNVVFAATVSGAT